MVTEDDLNMIEYFICERGDIERWSGWVDRKNDIEAAYPELIAALNNLKIAERTLKAVVKSLEQDYVD